ncbi:hypothetical protein RDn1_226 [Candidatus Termititenax dinenymphae]|uniref:Uncharacterized protein n=1 Tax=Candidatus Termititenax dinenymphae TaxID=2218523 RepID=A0A388TJR8_9BACT|nr:hypothetical protein RDn1_226 [Candidatus Termititenax dinenymphae]
MSYFLKTKQIADFAKVVEALNTLMGDFTPAGKSFVALLTRKLRDLNIDLQSLEASAFLLKITKKIYDLGYIPPLILQSLHDRHGNRQTLVISNLSVDEEKIIAACILTSAPANNESVYRKQPRQYTNPFSYEHGLLSNIYNTVMDWTFDNTQIAINITKQVQNALEKAFDQTPLQAVSSIHRLLTVDQIRGFNEMYMNPKGIGNYLRNRVQEIK